MKLATSRLLEKADFALATASELLQGGEPERSVGRAYYAMFYAGEAAVCEQAFWPPRASGGEDVDRPRGASSDDEYHRWLLETSNERIGAQDGTIGPSPAQAARSITSARDFIAAVRGRLPTK